MLKLTLTFLAVLKFCASVGPVNEDLFPVQKLVELMKNGDLEMETSGFGAHCRDRDDVDIQQTIIPWKFPGEGKGVIHIRRTGPWDVRGNEKLYCFITEDLGPPGSYWKGFWNRVVDGETFNTINYPPMYIHHWRGAYTNIFNETSEDGKTHAVFNDGRRQRDADVICPNIFGDDIKDVDIDSCSAVYYSHGIGQYIGEGEVKSASDKVPHSREVSDKRPRDFIRMFQLNDMRLEGAPAMTIYVETINFYITEPTIELKPSAPFGLDANAPLHPAEDEGGETTAYNVPGNDHSVQLNSYTMDHAGLLSDLSIHTHGHAGDEIWLVKGLAAELLNVPKDAEHARYYQTKSNCQLRPTCPINAIPLARLMPDDYASLTEALDGPDAVEAQLNEIKASFARRAGPDLLCRFRCKLERYNETRVAAIEAGQGEGAFLSKGARSGWAPGAYYRHAITAGPNCDTVPFEAGDIISIIGFNVNRGMPLRQHTVVGGIVSDGKGGGTTTAGGSSSGNNSKSRRESSGGSSAKTYPYCSSH